MGSSVVVLPLLQCFSFLFLFLFHTHFLVSGFRFFCKTSANMETSSISEHIVFITYIPSKHNNNNNQNDDDDEDEQKIWKEIRMAQQRHTDRSSITTRKERILDLFHSRRPSQQRRFLAITNHFMCGPAMNRYGIFQCKIIFSLKYLV